MATAIVACPNGRQVEFFGSVYGGPVEELRGVPRACWGSPSRSRRSKPRLASFTFQFRRSIRACRAAALDWHAM